MFKKVTKLLGAIALTGWMGVANATLIFDFSWDSADGQIIGVIEGLEDNAGRQQATSVTLISPNIGTMTNDYADQTSPHINVYFNRFAVVNGEISSVEFYGYLSDDNVNTELLMCSLPPCSFQGRGDEYWDYGEFYQHFFSSRDPVARSVPQYQRRETVPEPSTVILLSLGLAGLSLVRYRKLS